jgi:N-methylhydantoinase A
MEYDGKKLKAAFEAQYEQVYGLRIPNQEAEAITWSVTVSSKPEKPKRAAKAAARAAPKPRSRRSTYDPALGRLVTVPVYWRFDMAPGSATKGPAIIAEDETSTVVGANFRARIDSLGYIVMERLT